MSFLSVQNISKKIRQTNAVSSIGFEQSHLERLAIAGTTGSGKSTLLKLIAGLEQPDEGAVFFKSKRVLGPFEKLIPGHQDIAYLSQHFELRNNYWVHEILAYANLLSDGAAHLLYEVCDIQHLLQRRTDQLSGGEKQRIALARLLSTAPQLILLDEPFSNLDQLHKQTIRKVIHDIGATLKITCLLVSHDTADMLSWADRILVLKEGSIVQMGTPAHIYHQPIDAYVAGLFGPYTILPGHHPLVSQGPLKNQPQVFIRPSSFILSATQLPHTNSIAVKVEKVIFYGSYYLITVADDQRPYVISQSTPLFSIGEIVYLSITIPTLL